MKQLRVVCAACRVAGSAEVLIVGARHWDTGMHRTARLMFQNSSYSRADWEEGFIDQHNVFLTRAEAWLIAEAAGQILYRCGGDTSNGGTLYSENLY